MLGSAQGALEVTHKFRNILDKGGSQFPSGCIIIEPADLVVDLWREGAWDGAYFASKDLVNDILFDLVEGQWAYLGLVTVVWVGLGRLQVFN